MTLSHRHDKVYHINQTFLCITCFVCEVWNNQQLLHNSRQSKQWNFLTQRWHGSEESDSATSKQNHKSAAVRLVLSEFYKVNMTCKSI